MDKEMTEEVNQLTLYDQINRRVEAFAQERGYTFSTAREKILRELVKMSVRFGDFYCPCQAENAAHTVCVCEEVRSGYVDEVGKCHCNLFVLPR